MNVSIHFIYNLVENLPQKNEQNRNINPKYINNINNYHKRIKSSQISYDEYIEKGKTMEKKGRNKNIKIDKLNKIKINKNNLDIKKHVKKLSEDKNMKKNNLNKVHIIKKKLNIKNQGGVINKDKNIKMDDDLNNIKINKNNLHIKNPGVRLYEQNKEHISKKVKDLKERLEQEKKLEDLKLTFKPKINEYSRKLVGDDYNGIKIENRLLNFGKIYSEKNRSKQNINDNNDVNNKTNLKIEYKQLNDIQTIKRKKNLTPVNNINYINKSKKEYKMIKNKDNLTNKNNNKIKTSIKKSKHSLTPDKDLYEYLYLESKIRKQKRDDAIQKNLDLICPFKPRLNDSFNKNLKNDNSNVFDRLYNIKDENRKLTTEIKLKRKFSFYNDVDKSGNSNKKSYKKYINYKTYNNINNRNINDDNSYINSINKTINDDKNDKSDFDKENKKNYIQKSYATILKVKYFKLVELFNSLDSDKDGIISYKKIKLSNIEPEKLISLSPIFYEIQYKGLEFDFQKFCEKIQNIN